VYDSELHATILFGGCTKSCTFIGDYQNDTWEFTGGSWTNITSGASPDPRISSLVYDPNAGYLVLFAGYGVRSSGSPGYLDDTWAYS
jgi:hypothetical protein